MDDLQNKLREAEEEILQLKQKLKEANKELEMLSYSISHDLRAPLRAIKGFSEALLEDYNDKLDDEGKRYLNIVTTSTSQVYALMEGILSFSRFGRQEMNPAAIDMDELVRGVFAEIQAKNPNRKIEFQMEPLPPAHADLALIRQVWVNVLENAVKFSGPREVARVEIGGKAEANEVSYFIKDNGVGFDMRYADKLFGVFQRFHTEKEFPGVGMGLAIAQRLIRRHNGKIWADSKLGQGTTFHFSLPKN